MPRFVCKLQTRPGHASVPKFQGRHYRLNHIQIMSLLFKSKPTTTICECQAVVASPFFRALCWHETLDNIDRSCTAPRFILARLRTLTVLVEQLYNLQCSNARPTSSGVRGLNVGYKVLVRSTASSYGVEFTRDALLHGYISESKLVKLATVLSKTMS
jgi:hypothetical protein